MARFRNSLFSLSSARIAAAITTVLLFALPIVYMPGYGSFTIFRYFFFGTAVLILSVLTAWTWIRQPEIPRAFFKSWLNYGLIACWFAFTIVSITSTDPAVSFFSSIVRTDGGFAMFFLTLFALNCYTLVVLGGKKFLRQLLIASVLGTVALSVSIMLMTSAIARGGGLIGNSSLAASYVVWNIFFAVYLAVTADSRTKKMWWFGALAALLLTTLFVNWKVITGKLPYDGFLSIIGTARGALLGIIGGAFIALCTWLSIHTAKVYARLGKVLLGVIAVLIAVTTIVLFKPTSLLHEKFIEHTTESRFIFWDIALKGFRERPIVGWGPGMYSTPYHKFFNVRMLMEGNPREVLVDKPHNIFVEALVTGGLLLFAAFVFFLVTIITGLRRFRITDRWGAILFTGGFAAWLLQAQFVFDSIASLAMLFLVAALAYASKTEPVQRPQPTPGPKGKILVAGLALLALIIFVYTIALPNKKSRLMSKVYNTQLPARAALWPSLEGISPIGDQYDSALTLNQVYEGYRKNLDKFRDSPLAVRKVLLQEIDNVNQRLDLLIERRPYEYELVLLGARLRHVRMLIAKDFSGEIFERAKILAGTATVLSPTDPRAQVTLLRIQGKLGIDALE